MDDTRWLGGNRVNVAIDGDSCLVRYITPRVVPHRERSRYNFMTYRDSDPKDYKGIEFEDAGLMGKGIAPEKKVEVVAAMLITGSVKDTASMTGIKHSAVRKAMDQEWYKKVYSYMVRERGEELKAKCNKLVDKLMAGIDDRIENGDEKASKSGGSYNISVSARDCAYILGVINEQRRNIDHGEYISKAQDEAEKMLERISKAFEDVARIHRAKDVTPR